MTRTFLLPATYGSGVRQVCVVSIHPKHDMMRAIAIMANVHKMSKEKFLSLELVSMFG